MSIEAKLAIHETIARYSYTYDDKDADGFARVFVENGVFEIFVPGKTGPAVRLQSRRDIREWAFRAHTRNAAVQGRHYPAGVLFDDLTNEEARVRVMVVVTRQEGTDTRPYVHLTGVYHDVWRKTPDGWRLAHRAAYADRDPGFSA